MSEPVQSLPVSLCGPTVSRSLSLTQHLGVTVATVAAVAGLRSAIHLSLVTSVHRVDLTSGGSGTSSTSSCGDLVNYKN